VGGEGGGWGYTILRQIHRMKQKNKRFRHPTCIYKRDQVPMGWGGGGTGRGAAVLKKAHTAGTTAQMPAHL
jgi:hypothetical protein